MQFFWKPPGLVLPGGLFLVLTRRYSHIFFKHPRKIIGVLDSHTEADVLYLHIRILHHGERVMDPLPVDIADDAFSHLLLEYFG